MPPLFIYCFDGNSSRIIIHFDNVVADWIGQVAYSPLEHCGCVLTTKHRLKPQTFHILSVLLFNITFDKLSDKRSLGARGAVASPTSYFHVSDLPSSDF